MYALSDEEMRQVSVIPPHIWSGRALNDSYTIGDLIERGAVAEVYDGTEISTGERVAIKILLPHLAADAKIRSQFLDEARTLTRSSRPGLLRYLTCAHDPKSGLTYIVTAASASRSAQPARRAGSASLAPLAADGAADRFGSRRTVGASVAFALLAAAGFWMSQTMSPSAPRAASAEQQEGTVYGADATSSAQDPPAASVMAVKDSIPKAAEPSAMTVAVPAQQEPFHRAEPIEVAEQATNATDAGSSAPAGADQAIAMKEAAAPPAGLQEAANEAADAAGTADRALAEKATAAPSAATQHEAAMNDHGLIAPAGTVAALTEPPKAAGEAAEQANSATESAESERTANRRSSRGLFSRLLGGGEDQAATAKDAAAPPASQQVASQPAMSARSSTESSKAERTADRRGLRGLFNRMLGGGDDQASAAKEVAIDKVDPGAGSGRPSAR